MFLHRHSQTPLRSRSGRRGSSDPPVRCAHLPQPAHAGASATPALQKAPERTQRGRSQPYLSHF
eukprot:962312-Amphidinium_carterae.1